MVLTSVNFYQRHDRVKYKLTIYWPYQQLKHLIPQSSFLKCAEHQWYLKQNYCDCPQKMLPPYSKIPRDFCMMKHYFQRSETSLYFFICGNYLSQACALKGKKSKIFFICKRNLSICLKIKPHSTLHSLQHSNSELSSFKYYCMCPKEIT